MIRAADDGDGVSGEWMEDSEVPHSDATPTASQVRPFIIELPAPPPESEADFWTWYDKTFPDPEPF